MPNGDNNVRAVERALQILDCYSGSKTNFSLVELSREIDLSPSTTLRLIATLESRHYLYRDPVSLRYYLGWKLIRIGSCAFADLDVRQVAHPYIERLAQLYDESVGLYLLQGDRRVCVDRVEGSKSLRRVIKIGDSHTLTRGASGKVLLAYLSENRRSELLTADPLTTQEELAEIRHLRYAVSHGEREEGVVSVAAPVLGADGQALAAIFISTPELRASEELLEMQSGDVKRFAMEVSERLGFAQKDKG